MDDPRQQLPMTDDRQHRSPEVRRLQERIGALENEVNTLRRADERKDEFLAMLGHELRNPLAPIVTAIQLMKLRGQNSCERERTVIERQVRLLAQIVDDLLDLSRIARG